MGSETLTMEKEGVFEQVFGGRKLVFLNGRPHLARSLAFGSGRPLGGRS